jgi:SPP1 gp7 family putative phage head morphogenesis protein
LIPPFDEEDYDPDNEISGDQKQVIGSAIIAYEKAFIGVLIAAASKNYIKGAIGANKLMGNPGLPDVISEARTYVKSYSEMLNAGYTMIQGEKLYWLKDRVLEDRQKIFDIITEGLKDGKTTAEIAQEYMDYFQSSKEYAQMLCQTETAYVQAMAQEEQYKINGVKTVFWVLGDKPCSECEMYGNQTYTWEELPAQIPVHPRCWCSLVPAD